MAFQSQRHKQNLQLASAVCPYTCNIRAKITSCSLVKVVFRVAFLFCCFLSFISLMQLVQSQFCLSLASWTSAKALASLNFNLSTNSKILCSHGIQSFYKWHAFTSDSECLSKSSSGNLQSVQPQKTTNRPPHCQRWREMGSWSESSHPHIIKGGEKVVS